jgi:hypothetical protein
MAFRTRYLDLVLILATTLLAVGCAPKSRMGMVVDRHTGLQYGSAVERSFVLDPSQFADRRLKLRIRNTSGDPVFNLYAPQSALETAYQSNGYQLASGDDYGLLLDVDVRYSGQSTTNLSEEFTFLGGATGGLAAYAKTRGGIETVAGTMAGATLGHIMGSYQREETFVIVARVTLGLIDKDRGLTESKILFGKTQDRKSQKASEFRAFRDRVATHVAVFAGGTNISQSDISQSVKQRFQRILADII